MRLSDAARVGITVLLATVLLIAGVFWLQRNWGAGDTYARDVTFPDAQGIQKGAYVRVRGVDVGSVSAVRLGSDASALITLRIRKPEVEGGYRLSARDSIKIVAGVLGFSPSYIEITPNARAADAATGEPTVLVGQTGPGMNEILSESDRLLHNLNTLTERMSRVSGSLAELAEDRRLRNSLIRTTDNFARVSESGVAIGKNLESTTAQANRLVGSFQGTAAQLDRTLRQTDRLMAGFRGTADESRALMRDSRALVRDTRGVVEGAGTLVRSTNSVVENAGGLVTDTRGTLTENRERLKEVLETLNSSLKQLDGTLAEARSFLGDTELRTDFRATARNIRDATDNLKKITDDVQGLTGDPKVQEDLKATVGDLRDATRQAAELFRRVGGVLGTGGSKAKTVGQRFSEADLSVELLRGMQSERTRIDFDATIPWSERTFYRLGFYDFGETNRLNLQLGQQLKPNIWTRYGIRASKLGAGLDIGDRRRPPFTLDVFGVDSPQVDVRGNLPISPYLDLTVGIDNITRRSDPLIGVRYRR